MYKEFGLLVCFFGIFLSTFSLPLQSNETNLTSVIKKPIAIIGQEDHLQKTNFSSRKKRYVPVWKLFENKKKNEKSSRSKEHTDDNKEGDQIEK